jgi:hypothetical protein
LPFHLPEKRRHRLRIPARVRSRWRGPTYVRLLSVTNASARAFYETEALRDGWTIRQLARQIETQFYERSALSKNKAAMLQSGERRRSTDAISPEEQLKDPFVLEFLGLRRGAPRPSVLDTGSWGRRGRREDRADPFRRDRRHLQAGTAAPSDPDPRPSLTDPRAGGSGMDRGIPTLDKRRSVTPLAQQQWPG